VFGAFWLVTVPAALWRLAIRRGRFGYDKMAHVGPVDDAIPVLDRSPGNAGEVGP
jgi:hypothetical protein